VCVCVCVCVCLCMGKQLHVQFIDVWDCIRKENYRFLNLWTFPFILSIAILTTGSKVGEKSKYVKPLTVDQIWNLLIC
jgi:hypothetical protein